MKELTLNRRETLYLFRLKERGQGRCDVTWGRAGWVGSVTEETRSSARLRESMVDEGIRV